jgi:predicted nuclease of predicted toxin-antitoxin system
VKLKLDENIHRDVLAALVAQHHDVTTVHVQGLSGRPDADIARVVRTEARCLVTFDLDFSDTRRYPPAHYAGIVVLRLGAPSARNQIACLTRFFAETPDVIGRLWIVEDARARDWTPGAVSEHVPWQYQAASP